MPTPDFFLLWLFLSFQTKPFVFCLWPNYQSKMYAYRFTYVQCLLVLHRQIHGLILLQEIMMYVLLKFFLYFSILLKTLKWLVSVDGLKSSMCSKNCSVGFIYCIFVWMKPSSFKNGWYEVERKHEGVSWHFEKSSLVTI